MERINIKEYLAGTIGGCIGTIISHPFDTLRIKLQTESKLSLLQATRNIYSKGIFNFYKGITPPLIGISLEKSIVFGTFYNLEKNPILKDKFKKYNLYLNGFIAGFLSTIIVTPVERFKIALQTNQNIRKIKINTIYSGWLSTVLRESPGYAIYFKTYELLKKENDTKINTFINGSLSGMSAWLFIYPSDRVKTLVQNKNANYSNIMKEIYFKEGVLGYYRGFSLALLRCIPLHGGVFVGYEFVKNLFKNTCS
jgi:solute carrier family 25 (mitochondrial carnitine/acylcarnitine transporter), member 20/29